MSDAPADQGKDRKPVNHRVVSTLANAGFQNPVLRYCLFRGLEGLVNRYTGGNGLDRPEKVRQDVSLMARALLKTLDRLYSSGSISAPSSRALTDIFIARVVLRAVSRRKSFEREHGYRPPGFVTIAPTNACNLQCAGCYAGRASNRQALPWETLNRFIDDFKNFFDSRFMVISGGEPFMYREGGRGFLDLLERHSDVYFMVYTNGTLIDRETAGRLGRLGNCSPAISVEGLEKETDGRRGRGVFRKVVSAMDNLRENGVPYGFSATPTRSNADFLLSDEFLDYFFRRRAVAYGWYFQYMPIGANPSMDLMVTPEQRRRMLDRIWELVEKQNLFIGDFWNSGTASDGCLAAGRGGGYFYLRWDGTVTPCVFIPFRDRRYGNIIDVYREGGSILDILSSPFFREIRCWQDQYWRKQPAEKCGNLLAPCIIRDNCLDFLRLVDETGARGIDGSEQGFIPLARGGELPSYNENYRRLVDPLWRSEYLGR